MRNVRLGTAALWERLYADGSDCRYSFDQTELSGGRQTGRYRVQRPGVNSDASGTQRRVKRIAGATDRDRLLETGGLFLIQQRTGIEAVSPGRGRALGRSPLSANQKISSKSRIGAIKHQ